MFPWRIYTLWGAQRVNYTKDRRIERDFLYKVQSKFPKKGRWEIWLKGHPHVWDNFWQLKVP